MSAAKVIGYIRVSTENQIGEDKFGLDVQKRQIIEYCESNGLELVDIISDEGVSGAKIDRPGLNRVLREAESGAFDTVIVAKYDRLSRELFVQLWIEKELGKFEISVMSATEPYSGDDVMMTAFRQMVGVFAQLERGRITERLSESRREKASKGGYAGGVPPLGYVAERGSRKLSVDEEKAATVREIFALRAEGLSMEKIANAINANGRTTREGKKFTAMAVKRVLDNEEFYRGNYIYDKNSANGAKVVEGAAHQPILN